MTRGGNRKQRAPVYSADTLALRIFFGIALAALGVVIFLAVVMKMGGTVFEGLRNFCFGLTGSMAILLPVLPLWAGILLIWSSQSRAPVRPLLWGSLAYVGVCTFIVLVTRYGNQTFLGYLTQVAGNSWGDVIREGFRGSMILRQSGGALGILLGWPLRFLLGDVLSAGIVLILTLLALLMAVNLSPLRIRDLITGKAHFRRSRQEAEQARINEEQIAWQQEQERQRQAQAAAWQQQQILQQQMQQNARAATQGNQAYTAAQGYSAAQPYTPPRTGAGPLPDDGGVGEWQQSIGAQQAGATQGYSQILDAKQPEMPAEKPKGFLSKIFGRQSEGDGLSDASAQEKARIQQNTRDVTRYNAKRKAAQEAAGMNAGKSPAKTVPVRAEAPIRPEPAEDPRQGYEPEDGAYSPAQQAPVRRSAEEQNAYRRPQPETPAEAVPAAVPERPVPQAAAQGRTQGQGAQATTQARMQGQGAQAPAQGRTQAPAQAAQPQTRPEGRGRKAAAWQEQLEDAERKATGDNTQTPAAGRNAEVRRPERVAPPAVQQKIGEETWKPELNHLNGREEDREPAEEYWTPTPYYAPLITDLHMPKPNTENTAQEDAMRSQRLEETLASFNVTAHVVHVTHGPAISRFELELASGTKVSKVAGLEKDIAYGMQATSVRIEAPIPGKSLVGVEVPNRKVSTVTLREVLESPALQNAKSILTVALGKDIAGTPVVCDLAKMPHMLIAGATGSGKSVCINTIINSLLFRAGPDEVKLILVDPKVVELQVYNNIPHLLIPVVSDPHKAAAALAWAVAEMMDRYDRFAKRKVRNLDGYNTVLEPGEKPMPRIVIIIDELADLMMVCKKDVEEYICRLTQLARAAGIHLIVATQRPSVDVITGLIKANIPSRIAFKTASYVDSRTILDRNGSEALLGYGDMLYLPTGSFSPTRIQGCFLSDEEVNKIAADVKQNNPSSYDQDILDKLDELSSEAGETPGMDMIGGVTDTAADGNLFEQAVEYAIADGQISTSTLQRRLKVGYARAGRLTDEMEERGIVSAKDGSKPRKCLITREQWEEMKKATEGMS